MLLLLLFFNISVKERGTKCPFVRLLDMKKKERMKIYTLLLGALFVSPTQAQTMHDWENHHVLGCGEGGGVRGRARQGDGHGNRIGVFLMMIEGNLPP